MDSPRTPGLDDEGQWIDSEAMMSASLARFRAGGGDAEGYEHFRRMFDEDAKSRYENPARFAKQTGCVLEFDAAAAWDGCSCDPRCRLSMEGREVGVFEDVLDYYAWAKSNLPMLKARAERERLASEAPPAKAWSSRPRRPGL